MNFKLKKYHEYFENINYLKSDILFLQNQQAVAKSEDGARLLEILKSLEKDFQLIKNPQSISIFIEKAKNFRWKNIEKRGIDLKDKCENINFSIQICNKGIFDLQSFALQSNLSDKYIDAIVNELEYYKMQQEKIASHGREFQNHFDLKVKSFNEKMALEETLRVKKSSKEISASLLPLNKLHSIISKNLEVPKEMKLEFNSNLLTYVSVSLLILLFLNKLLMFFYKKIQFNKLKANYFKLLAKIQNITRVKIRSFGSVDSLSLSPFAQHFTMIDKTFCQKNKFNGELHFIILRNEKATRLEVKYQSSESFHLIYDNQSSDLSNNIKVLSSDIENANGEFLISTKFNSEGLVTSSSLNLILPNQ